jgi:hypothetical protein
VGKGGGCTSRDIAEVGPPPHLSLLLLLLLSLLLLLGIPHLLSNGAESSIHTLPCVQHEFSVRLAKAQRVVATAAAAVVYTGLPLSF